jgi:hypothetical protein
MKLDFIESSSDRAIIGRFLECTSARCISRVYIVAESVAQSV